MVLEGETIATGASRVCRECGKEFELRVCKSGAGYYIGTWCCMGPHSRESGYFETKDEAEQALASGFKPRGSE